MSDATVMPDAAVPVIIKARRENKSLRNLASTIFRFPREAVILESSQRSYWLKFQHGSLKAVNNQTEKESATYCRIL
jgi:uncharacterized protein YecT (DUF1311 family)